MQGAHGIVVVQGEDVLGYSAKLHDDVVGCRAREESRQCISLTVKMMCVKKKKKAGDKQRELLTVVVVNYLEVFDRGLGNAAVEVEHVGLGVVVPHRRLVVQLDEVVQRVTLPPAQEALLLLHTEILSYKKYTQCRR